MTRRELAVGDRVVVLTMLTDPVELELHPHTVVAEVWDGPLYLVENVDAFGQSRFGPFTRDRLRPGW